MKKILLGLLIFSFFSCKKESDKDIYLGKLEELIVGDFSLVKDSLTNSIHTIRVIKDKELLVTTKSTSKFKGWAFVFTSPETGKEVHRVEIPTEGPESMKGGILAYVVSSQNQIFLINSVGEIGEYNFEGKQVNLYKYLKERAEQEGKELTTFSNGKELSNFNNPILQLGLNPNVVTNWKDLPGPGEMRSEFPLDFKEWIISINLKTGEVLKSDFSIPKGYEKFKGDLTSTILLGDWDSKRRKFYLAWPGTSEIFILNGVNLDKEINPSTQLEFNYIPSEVIPWGVNATVWALPKNASSNIFLIYDEKKDLILRCTKINESGPGETKFERTKHYVLGIYTGEWDLLGEYLFDFKSELDLENWFLTSEGLFINKPEQKSEDEYEFYKVDLSQFRH